MSRRVDRGAFEAHVPALVAGACVSCGAPLEVVARTWSNGIVEIRDLGTRCPGCGKIDVPADGLS